MSIPAGPLTLTGKVVVVTGGAGYLGKTFGRGIAEQGGVVCVADIDSTAAAAAAAQIAADFPGRASAAPLDITSEQSIDALIHDLAARHGRIDAVVNNAYPRNARYGRKLEEVSYDDFCENVSSHLGGYFLVAKQFALFFKEQGGGTIVNMSSIYGLMAPRFEIYEGTTMTMPVEYAAIKSGVIHLTRYFAKYFRKDGVRVNCLSPGGVRDRQPPRFTAAYDAHAGRKGMLDPADLVGGLLFLLSDASLQINGQNLVVDDGFSL